MLGLVPIEMNLYKGLNGQAKPGWIKPGCIAGNIACGVSLCRRRPAWLADRPRISLS